MNKLLLAIILLTGANNLYSQEKASLLFTGSFVSCPEFRMKGTGYSLAFQQHFHARFALELGGGYSLASFSNERGEIVNDVRLLELNYHHAGYSFYAAPVLKIGNSKIIGMDLFAGAVISYQSYVLDQYHYELPESPDYIVRMFDIVYGNKVVEGAFPGGIAGCRIKVKTGERWSVLGNLIAIGIPKGVSSVNAGLGIQFSW